MAILIVADLVPVVAGLKVTWKVVELLPAMLLGGICVKLKSLVAPVITTYGNGSVSDRVPGPRFSIVKVRTTLPAATTALPKSVWSAASGVLSPSAIVTVFPLMFISIAGIIVISPLVNGALVKTVELAPPLIVKLAFEPMVKANVPVADAPKSAVIK